MGIVAERTFTPEVADRAWSLYLKAFEELKTVAVQRHVMHRAEFDAVMADERVWKYRATGPDDPDVVTALATVTNDLPAMPLISPEYFAHRWPQLYAEARIWYLGFFAIDPQLRGSGLFEE